MPALDLALCLRMVGRAADLSHLLCIKPLRQIRRDVARTVIAEQARLMDDPAGSAGPNRGSSAGSRQPSAPTCRCRGGERRRRRSSRSRSRGAGNLFSLRLI
jgi:hypothetical protein